MRAGVLLGSRLSPFPHSAAAVGTAELGGDKSWLNVTGTVAPASADYFNLDYGEGIIRVGMDDGVRWIWIC